MINPKEFKNLAANGTYILSAESCNLGSVVINKAGATGNTLTLYNSNGDTTNPIAVIDTTTRTPLVYDISCPIGLTAVMATGTAADVTITLEGLN